MSGLRSDEGWLYASSLPMGTGDPGRFNALFGRDSLISSLQLLPVAPEIARATLRALARRQGRQIDTVTLERPGKIGHEFRQTPPAGCVESGWPESGEFSYDGTADATAWFLVVLAAVAEPELRAELESSWRSAGARLTGELDRGGGLARHAPTTVPGGLIQQGWRDSSDPTDRNGGGILRADATSPGSRLADADTQAVAFAALRALERLDRDGGWEARAVALRSRISAAFGPEVMALEAARLSQPDILTDFGLRTLSPRSPLFDPHAYHRGSVWPFDSWLGWGALRACGRDAEADQVRTGVLRAIRCLGDAPELYAVSRAGALAPIALANRRQAWTIGAQWARMNGWAGRPTLP